MQRCSDGSIVVRNATALRYSVSIAAAHDGVEAKKNFFFLNDSWQVQGSSTSSSALKKERKRESFESCFGLIFPSSLVLV